MSASTPNQVSGDFLQHFEKATSGADNVRFFQLSINSQEIINEGFASGPCGSSVQADFDEMKQRAVEDEPCYFLFRMDASNPKEWLFVSWVPDRASPDKKMLYSAAKGRLKDKLGFTLFVGDEHCSVMDELTWSAFSEKHEDTDDRSEFEKQHDKIVQAEVSEAAERAAEGAASQGAASAQTSHASGAIGGFHTVHIPLSDAAKDGVRQLESGAANLLELAINDAKTSLDCVSVSKVAGNAAVRSALNTQEPRFYAYCVPRPVPGSAKDVVFIYSCPDAAPQRLRMVYSTAKNSTADAIVDTCPSLNMGKKQLEVREGDELDDATIREATTGRGGVSVIKAAAGRPGGFGGYAGGAGARFGAQDNGGTVNTAQNINRVGGGAAGNQGQHPIYGLLGSNSTASGRKKIVIPPKHAW